AFFAKAAELLRDDTFAVVGGGFDAVLVPDFPLTVPMVSLVIKLLVRPEECGREYRLRLEAESPGGQALLPLAGAETPFTPQLDPNLPGKAVGFTTIITTANLVLPEPGDCEFRFFVDGQQVGSVR